MYVLKLFFILGLLFCVSCTKFKKDQWKAELIDENEFHVGIRNSAFGYYLDSNNEHAGYEYELVSKMAKNANLKLKLHKYNSLLEMKKDLKNKKIDIIADFQMYLDDAKRQDLGPNYANSKLLLVCNYKIYPNKEVPLILEKGNHFSRFYLQKKKVFEYTKSISEVDSSVDSILVDIATTKDNKLCTLADEFRWQYFLRRDKGYLYYKVLSDKEPISWFLNGENKKFRKWIFKWQYDQIRNNYFEQLYESYFGYWKQQFNSFDASYFKKKISTSLPKYKKYFEVTAQKYNLPWQLLAALSYQESHWNPNAKSPTGVRGLMMLTRNTAQEMSVDRLNPAQSIDGGARYLIKLRDMLPEDIKEPDRTWITLASYNVGLGHVLDARTLVRRNGGKPHLWKEIRNYLPLIAEEKYFHTLKYGYARGWEPVQYVRRIRNYYELLKNEPLVLTK